MQDLPDPSPHIKRRNPFKGTWAAGVVVG